MASTAAAPRASWRLTASLIRRRRKVMQSGVLRSSAEADWRCLTFTRGQSSGQAFAYVLIPSGLAVLIALNTWNQSRCVIFNSSRFIPPGVSQTTFGTFPLRFVVEPYGQIAFADQPHGGYGIASYHFEGRFRHTETDFKDIVLFFRASFETLGPPAGDVGYVDICLFGCDICCANYCERESWRPNSLDTFKNCFGGNPVILLKFLVKWA